MANPQPQKNVSDRDRLVTRPPEPLPAAEDPKKPRGFPDDPKDRPPEGQGTDPKADDIGYTA